MEDTPHDWRNQFVHTFRTVTFVFVSAALALAMAMAYLAQSKGEPLNGFDFVLMGLIFFVVGSVYVMSVVHRLDAFLSAHFSNVDAITGLPNRRAYEIRLNEEWNRLTAEQGTMTLLFIDIDRFKDFNTCNGHALGDHVLKVVGASIKTSLMRSTDFCCRWGGDEFVVLMPKTDMEGGMAMAQRIVSLVSSSAIQMNGTTCHPVSVSVGVSNLVCTVGTYPMQLERLADGALLHAKAMGRNRVEFCAP